MISAAIPTESPLVALSLDSLPTESVTPNEMVMGTPAIDQSPPTASRQTPSSRPPSRVTEIFSSKAIKREKGSTGVDLDDLEAEAKYRWRIPRGFVMFLKGPTKKTCSCSSKYFFRYVRLERISIRGSVRRSVCPSVCQSVCYAFSDITQMTHRVARLCFLFLLFSRYLVFF